MSSVPHSPRWPGTPVKSNVAAEAQETRSRTPSGRTRLPDGRTPRSSGIGTGKGKEKDKEKEKEKEMDPDLSGLELQVPSTIPSRDMEKDHMEKDQKQEPHSDQTEIADDPQANLPPFDWESFQLRYMDALVNASDQEDEILADFEKLSTTFRLWAQAGSEKDNDRSIKRKVLLKTQERYVQISEQSLEEKKQHYTSVVDAFQRAINMLRRPGARK